MITTREELVTELARTQAAILKATTAESYSVGDQSVQRRLDELRNHRAYLERQIAAIDAETAGAANPIISVATWA